MHAPRIARAVFAGALLAFATAGSAAGSQAERTAFVVPVSATADEHDFAFLAAVSAAAHGNNGTPVVLAVDPADPWRPEVVDFLRRYDPDRLEWIGDDPASRGPWGKEFGTTAAPASLDAACALAREFAPSARRIVVSATDDRPAALAAAVLAARLDAPLFPCRGDELSDRVLALAVELGTERALLVNGSDAVRERLHGAGLAVERLTGPLEVAERLRKARLATDYMVAVDGTDADDGRVRKLSLAAVLLAVGRDGVLAPLDLDTRWKERHSVDEKTMDDAARTGVIDLDGESIAFMTGTAARGGHAWMRMDRDADGAFEGADEGPFRTGDVVALGARRWMVDLDVEENARGAAVWLTSPPVDEVAAALAQFRRAVGEIPSHLVLVGGPDAIPMAIIGDSRPIDADLVSDLPYGQIDDDPFIELALTRFPVEDHVAGTLLACRGFVHDDLRDGTWDRAFATVEWERTLAAALEESGLDHAGHHAGAPVLTEDSPLTEVAVLAHGSHAMWTCLGGFYTNDSTVLVAPCVVGSSGCSTASLDQDAAHRSVATRLLRNGAAAFMGNMRRGVAQQDLFQSEFWNALLAGHSLGEANRYALNRAMVAVLEKRELTGGLYRYQLYSAAVYGDPAWSLTLPDAGEMLPARTELRGLRATVHGPSHWWRSEQEANAEWGYVGTGPIHHWRAPGVGVENWWHGGERRNANDLLYTAEIRTRRKVVGVEQVGEIPAPLGWTGSCFVDEHADGTRSLYWRIRFLDFDMTTGEEHAKIDSVEFRLLSK